MYINVRADIAVGELLASSKSSKSLLLISVTINYFLLWSDASFSSLWSFYIQVKFFFYPKMKAYSVMNVIHLRWSHRNECDLRTDIGTWIASSLSYPVRVQMRVAKGSRGVPI